MMLECNLERLVECLVESFCHKCQQKSAHISSHETRLRNVAQEYRPPVWRDCLGICGLGKIR